jgi:ABC-type multidrug transport system ATPase subunit
MSHSPSPAIPALSTHGLAKDYGDRPALEPLDLLVGQGQHVALVGHNGSGKTTLLRMAAGLLDPSDGEARIMGRRAGSMEARRALSWLSDTPTFYDDLSLWEHLEYVGRLHGVADWADKADSLLTRLQLGDRRDDIPTTFSRGLRQKAAISIALVRPFDVMLVDEPFVGLDQAGKNTLLELLDEAAAAGATLLVATHELAFVSRVQRLLALRDGALVYDGAPEATDVHALVLPA